MLKYYIINYRNIFLRYLLQILIGYGEEEVCGFVVGGGGWGFFCIIFIMNGL